jgi:phosphomevalonate kinase
MKITAPGKLFLTGEYAVLWGAPAILAAVAPRLSATLDVRPGEEILLRVPGSTLRGHREGQTLSWSGPPAPARFAARALELALEGHATPAFALQFARSPRGDKGQKLGLGSSSAAAAIAAAAGLQIARQPVDPDRVFPIAARAHWEVQGGKGSNGDVAAACYGGLLRYLRYPVERPPSERPPRPEVTPLVPDGLRLALVFSGRSAKTPSMVSAVERALTERERQGFVTESTQCTDAFTYALGSNDHAGALKALDAAGDLLVELGQRAEVAVVTPRLAEKVSGAGGGDGALFAGFEAGAMREALRAARAQGLMALELTLSSGVA